MYRGVIEGETKSLPHSSYEFHVQRYGVQSLHVEPSDRSRIFADHLVRDYGQTPFVGV